MHPAWLLAAVLLATPAAAQTGDIPGLEDAITDGVPFELDDQATVEDLKDFAARVSGQRVHDCVAMITRDAPYNYRLMGTPTQQFFLEKYQDVFAELGLPSDLHHFERGGPAAGSTLPTGGTNIVGVLPGTDPTKWVVMGGHYDTRELTLGGGALDNASGICTVHEIAAAMKAHADEHGPPEASVVFLWYDGEEWGLYGAVAFAEDPSVAKRLLGLDEDAEVDILVSQSYDMPGINYPAKNTWIEYGDPDTTDEYAVLNLRTAPIHDEEEWRCWSYGCYEELKDRDDFPEILRQNTNHQFLVRETAYDLMGYSPEFVWIYDDNYGRSDHIPLIAQGAAGMRIQGSHDEEYPCYHQPCDTLDWLYIQTGGQEALIAAYDTEARVGGTVAHYVASTAEFGHYGDVLWFGEDAVQYGPEGAYGDGGDQDSPGFALVAALAVLGLAVVFARRRQ